MYLSTDLKFFEVDPMVLTNEVFKLRLCLKKCTKVPSPVFIMKQRKRVKKEKGSILQNQMRKDCAITHIPLRMNRGILHFAANYIDSFGEECV